MERLERFECFSLYSRPLSDRSRSERQAVVPKVSIIIIMIGRSKAFSVLGELLKHSHLRRWSTGRSADQRLPI